MSIWEHYQQWHSQGFCRVDPPMQELHWRKLSKTIVYKTDAQWTHWAMKTWWIGPLEVMEFQETNEFDVSSIPPLVAELCRVESRMKMLFKDTWWLSIRERKNKWSSNIACHCFQQLSMGNADMGTLPRLAWWRVLQSWPTNSRVALKETEQNPTL